MQNEPVSPLQGPEQSGVIDAGFQPPIAAATGRDDSGQAVPREAETKHVLASKTIAGVVLLLLPAVAKKLGVQLSDADSQAVAEQVVELIGAGLAIYGRCAATRRLTLGMKSPTSAGALLAVVLGMVVGCYFPGCATDTGDAKRDRAGRVTNVVLTNLLGDAGQLALGVLEQTVKQAAAGNTSKRNLQDAAATGLWQSVGTIDVAGDVARIVAAWNGGSAPQVATAAAQVFAAAAPATPADKAAVANVIATTISQAAASSRRP